MQSNMYILFFIQDQISVHVAVVESPAYGEEAVFDSHRVFRVVLGGAPFNLEVETQDLAVHGPFGSAPEREGSRQAPETVIDSHP